MPAIKLQHVVSVSSEDKNFPAENLLKNDSFKKWKCVAGEKNAAVTLQFEKASEINQIDIGNEGSAFIEVLVGKSAAGEDSYQVILMSSSFMNPAESRSSQNLNRVRIFGTDALSKAVLGLKWDRVKIVCTQPFAKGKQYGLSFIRFYSSPNDDNNASTKGSPSKQLTLGAFVLKNDVPAPSIKAGSLFEQSQQKVKDLPLTGAAAIRAASNISDKQTEEATSCFRSSIPESDTVQSSPVTQVKKTKLPDGSKKDADKTIAKASKDEPKSNVKRLAMDDSLESPAKKSKSDPVVASSSEALSSVASSSEASSFKEKTFNKLLERVVFVLSGFQNPYRGDLREKAREMGAKYEADWGPCCTHLVCAFENTPKYSEVKGKGRIVKKEWLLDCYKQKKLLPWRQYRLGRAPSPNSTDSENDSSEKNRKSGKVTGKIEKVSNTASSSKLEAKKDTQKMKMETEKKHRNGNRKTFHQLSYEGDTDSLSDSDEKRPEVKTSETCIPSTSAQKNDEDIFNASTDEESVVVDGNESSDQLPELPDFFNGKSFFMYGSFCQDDRKALIRYITAYNGLVIDYMDDTIDYVVTDEPWDENFDQALSENGSLIFVKSSWIFACHEAQKKVPHQKYVISVQ